MSGYLKQVTVLSEPVASAVKWGCSDLNISESFPVQMWLNKSGYHIVQRHKATSDAGLMDTDS